MSDKTFYSFFITFFVAVFCLSHIERSTALADHAPDAEATHKVLLRGVVCDEPQRREASLKFCFKPYGYGDLIMVTAGRYPEYEYGYEAIIFGKLEFPENFDSYEGGPEFDYISYLARDGIRYLMFRPDIVLTGEGKGNPLMSFLLSIKSSFVRKMELLILEPESSLLGGILLGDRSAIEKDIALEFKKAGLAHILVLSGYNVTIVAESLMRLFSFLPRSIGTHLGAISIFLFALMTGASATTIRASIMALIVILARSASRRYDPTRALLVAAFLMTVHDPFILAFDISFQLSFLATLSLIFVSPLISDRIPFITERFDLREICASSIGAQIFVAPFLAYSMGELSLISLLSNISVLPIVPYAMFLGFVSIIAGFAFLPIALPISWAVTFLLSYMLKAASFFASLPFASIRIHLGLPGLACIYAFYTILIIRLWRRRDSSRQSPN